MLSSLHVVKWHRRFTIGSAYHVLCNNALGWNNFLDISEFVAIFGLSFKINSPWLWLCGFILSLWRFVISSLIWIDVNDLDLIQILLLIGQNEWHGIYYGIWLATTFGIWGIRRHIAQPSTRSHVITMVKYWVHVVTIQLVVEMNKMRYLFLRYQVWFSQKAKTH